MKSTKKEKKEKFLDVFVKNKEVFWLICVELNQFQLLLFLILYLKSIRRENYALTWIVVEFRNPKIIQENIDLVKSKSLSSGRYQ
jgi:hypothetical protein